MLKQKRKEGKKWIKRKYLEKNIGKKNYLGEKYVQTETEGRKITVI